MDLTKLTPAPWKLRQDNGSFYLEISPENWLMAEYDRPDGGGIDALEFAALARNAFAGDPKAMAWWEANRVKPEAVLYDPFSRPSPSLKITQEAPK